MLKKPLFWLVVLQVLVALLPFLSAGYDLMKSLEADPVRLQLAATGINFAVLSAALFAQTSAASSENASRAKATQAIASSTQTIAAQLLDGLDALKRQTVRVEMIHARKFYLDFLSAAATAKTYVYISYFAPYSPLVTADNEREKYYREIESLTRSQSAVRFRRLVRDTEENRAWAKELAHRMSGVRNFDLALLTDAAWTKKSSTALSVQIVDDKATWLVALRSHEPESGDRDIHIEGVVFGEAMKGYYERLWSLATIVMESGNLTKQSGAIFSKVDPQ